eukprot:g12918.t1
MQQSDSNTNASNAAIAWHTRDTASSARSVLERCDYISTFTDTPGSITRLYLSDASVKLHGELRRWMEGAGLTVRVDNAGNLIARRGASHPTGATKALLVGSHLDTVPNAGRYDGVLGVMIALQAIEALGDAPLPFHIDLIGFSEEEGVRFGVPYIGSAAVAGCFDPAWLGRCDRSGQSLGRVIEQHGLKPDQIKSDAYRPDQVLGYTEVHLEQGPVLDSLDLPVGVVSGIQGQSRLTLRYTGHADHAGTVPMEHRRDALLTASRLVVAAAEYARSIEGLRATVGRLSPEPNVRNVVPGRVEQSLDIRHSEDAVREQAVTDLLQSAEAFAEAEGVQLTCRSKQHQSAMKTDPKLSAEMNRAVQQSGIEAYTLPSGAGHDAVMMARLAPVAMLFVRHPGGVSHHPDEAVHAEDAGQAVHTMGVVLIAPAIGSARFVQYLAFLTAESVAGPAPQYHQRFIYCLQGQIKVGEQVIETGGYAWLPPDSGIVVAGLTEAQAWVHEQPYQPEPGIKTPTPIIAHERDAEAKPFMDDPALRLAKLLPEEPAFDLEVNRFTFDPGASLPLVESHVNEHGLLMLEGGGVYRLAIDTDRLMGELHELAAFSACTEPSPAVTRVVFTEVDLAARSWLNKLFEQAGLSVRTDPIGNTYARWCPEGCDPHVPALGTGSHIDAIPHAGMYDGTVGVLGGLEAIRALQRAGHRPVCPIDAILFTSEEPTRFGIGCSGSRAMCGQLTPDRLGALKDEAGADLDAIRQGAGFSGPLDEVRLPGDAYAAFIELHIEQGPRLEEDQIDLAPVTAIAAPATIHFTMTGEGGHAGGVLMPDRKDAMCAAAQLISAIEAAAVNSTSPDIVATIGTLDIHPGAVNSIPSRVDFSLDLRDIDGSNRDAVLQTILETAASIAAQRGVDLSHIVLNSDPPAQCDPKLVEALSQAAEAGGYSYRPMISRAYHDSLFMATRFPTAMLFIPCRGGVSHRPDEYAKPKHIEAGVATLARTLASLSS